MDRTQSPLASVIVRSYHRPRPLMELIDRLRQQDCSSFEVVIVEQSDDRGIVAALEALNDPRLVVLIRPPLGAPAARNEGIRHARGEILVFIDDDDLPIGRSWLAAHLANYSDPLCVGVSGRLSPTEVLRNPRFPRLVHWAAMRYTPFLDPLTLPIGSLRKEGIDFLIGNNFSVRRDLVLRVGGWDEGIPMHEEHSFAFRFKRHRHRGEYFVYDPRPAIVRRVNLKGGLERRVRPDWHRNELAGRVIYYHHVVGHYFPWRFWALYPLFMLRAMEQVLVWIWDQDNRGRSLNERLRASGETLFALPWMVWTHGLRGAEEIRRVENVGRSEGSK